jgi:4-aminobutyrate aminotransferase-like enzyme
LAGWAFDLIPQAVPRVETRFRRIVTPLPVPESLEILKTLDDYESTSMHGQMPIVWDKAEGFQVHDEWGNTWIDFTSTIFVANAGHGNSQIIEAIQGQLAKPLLHSYTFATRVRAEYIKTLVQAMPPQFEKAFLLSAGTEATECAIKLMRMHGIHIGKRRLGLIAFEGNWHGRTMGAQMLSYNPDQKAWIGHHDPNIHHLPFPYPWQDIQDPADFFRSSLETLIDHAKLDPKQDLCGIMFETFQGWGAVFYPPRFVQAAVEFARENRLLIAFDEMQAGFGRTGNLLGYMHYGVEPDLICCGKGASSSLPLSFVMGPKAIMDLPEIGSMSSTHSANPMCCAAGLANLKFILENDLVGKSARLGEVLHGRLREIAARFPNHIRGVLGAGLLAALHFVDPAGHPLSGLASEICQEAMRRGLLVVHTGRESIKIAPPLVIEEEALREGLEVLEQSVNRVIARQES